MCWLLTITFSINPEELAGAVKSLEIPACAAWVVGSVLSFVTTYTSFSITTVPSIDGILAAFLVHFIWSKVSEKNRSIS